MGRVMVARGEEERESDEKKKKIDLNKYTSNVLVYMFLKLVMLTNIFVTINLFCTFYIFLQKSICYVL